MPATRAEVRTAMSRAAAPADTQWARALIAVSIGLLLACQVTGRVVTLPGPRVVPPELRALAGLPSLVIRHIAPEF